MDEPEYRSGFRLAGAIVREWKDMCMDGECGLKKYHALLSVPVYVLALAISPILLNDEVVCGGDFY